MGLTGQAGVAGGGCGTPRPAPHPHQFFATRLRASGLVVRPAGQVGVEREREDRGAALLLVESS